MPVLGIHEPKIKFGQFEFNHLVLVANITDEVLMGLDLMKQHKFHLDLENSVNSSQLVLMMAEQATRRVTLQGNDLSRAMEARSCQEGCKRFKMKHRHLKFCLWYLNYYNVQQGYYFIHNDTY